MKGKLFHPRRACFIWSLTFPSTLRLNPDIRAPSSNRVPVSVVNGDDGIVHDKIPPIGCIYVIGVSTIPRIRHPKLHLI
ncbi:MAG: hypothetical protein ACJAQT_002355 [Akkermansiaceae bacterium]